MRRLCSRRDWTARGIMGFEAASDAPPEVRARVLVAVATVAAVAVDAAEACAVVAARDDAAEPVADWWAGGGVTVKEVAAAADPAVPVPIVRPISANALALEDPLD